MYFKFVKTKPASDFIELFLPQNSIISYVLLRNIKN